MTDLDLLAINPDASQRLERIPGFVRKMVRQKAEAYAAAQGDELVTCSHLDTLTARRFGGKPPFLAPPGQRSQRS